MDDDHMKTASEVADDDAADETAPSPVVAKTDDRGPGDDDDDDMGGLATKPSATRKQAKTERYPPSCFTDEKGNLKFVNLVVKYPCVVFFSILILAVVFSFLLIAIVFAAGESPFADPGNEYDINDIRSIDYDSLRLANEEVASARDDAAAANQVGSVRRQEELLDITYWVFEGETDEGVFGSVKSIEGMREALDLFTTDADYENYCWLLYPEASAATGDSTNATTTSVDPTCRPPLSALNIYYASSWNKDTAQSVLDQLMLNYPSNVDRYNDLAVCVEFNLLCDEVPANYTEADFSWAQELNANITTLTSAWDGLGELQEENLDQVTTFCAYMLELFTKRGFVDFGFDKDFSRENMVSKYSRAVLNWGGPLGDTNNDTSSDLSNEDREDEDEEELRDYVKDEFLDEMNDIAATGRNPEINSYYFMGVLIFEVLIDIVTQDGLLAIASFVFVFLYIRIACGSWFLASIGFLEIVLSLPVAWFFYQVVFRIEYFAFLNTLSLFIVAAIGADDIFIFMDAYKQSAHLDDPEVLDSLESRMSWVYRRTGTAMAITSATTCSAFLCTLITPLAGVRAFGVFAATVILIDYILVMSLFCTAVVIYHNKFERPGCFSSCGAGCELIDPSSTQEALENIGKEDEKIDKIGDFFRYKVSPFINKSTNRIFVAVVFVAWIVVAIINAIEITPTTTAEQFLDEDHPLQKSFTLLNTAFPTAQDDIGLPIHFMWGLGKVSRSGVNLLLKPKFFGTPQYLETFDFNEECQTEMLRVCTDLKQNDEYRPFIKQEAGFGAVSCFIEEFGAYSALGSLDDCFSVRNGSWKNETWQVSPEDIPALLEAFVDERSCYSDEGQSILAQYEDDLGWDGAALRFGGLSVESSVIDPFSSLPEDTVRVQYDKMIEISKSLDTVMKDKCGGDTIMTDLEIKFVFMNNQRIYVRSAVQSSCLGVALAFTVLMISTRVFHIAFFATLSIISVLVSVTGTMVLIGWELGSIEAILISIVAGFSVDYVVHLSHAYVTARGDTVERITSAFGDMGISVLNGMITSVAASIPLFFCQLQFFRKFGTFLCLTIVFSWLFANFVFMSVLAQLKIPIKEEETGGAPPVALTREQALTEEQPDSSPPEEPTLAAPPIAASKSEGEVSA